MLGQIDVKKRLYILVLLVLLGGNALLFFVYRDRIAESLWGRYGNADLALLINHGNADLSMQLGNYYFGGVIRAEGGPTTYDLTKAKRAFLRAVEIDERVAWGHYQLARVYFVEGDFDRALTEINRELEFFPYNKRSLYIRGLIYGFRGEAEDLERAYSDFSEFISWAPTEWAGYNDLMWILLKQAEYISVKTVGDRAFQHVPDADRNPWILNSVGVAHLNLKEYKEAEDFFLRALAAAKQLSVPEWLAAYSANDPVTAIDGLGAFIEGIQKNLAVTGRFAQ